VFWTQQFGMDKQSPLRKRHSEMIISHSKKFVFFRVAKTGSTTTEFLLRLSNAFDLDTDTVTGETWLGLPTINPPWVEGRHDGVIWAHATPQELIDNDIMTIDQLREYDCYAFLRPMEDRFISACLHSMHNRLWGRIDSMGLQPEQFIKRWRDLKNGKVSGRGLLGKAQKEWFFVGDEQVVTPLNFAKYDDELKRLLALLGGNQFKEIPKLNANGVMMAHRKEWCQEIWRKYPEIRREVHALYAEDHQFYVDTFG